MHILYILEFLDGNDATLAGLVYGASQFKSYPVAIFQISMGKQNKEYLLCFHGKVSIFENWNNYMLRLGWNTYNTV